MEVFKQRMGAKQGIDKPRKVGELDSCRRMLNGSGSHCAAAEEHAAEREMSGFRTDLAEMEANRAMAIHYFRLFQATR